MGNIRTSRETRYVSATESNKLMRSLVYWRCHIINITITILDIIRRPVVYLKHSVLEAWFCLRLQVEPTQLHQIG
jgi:hypothetical protein